MTIRTRILLVYLLIVGSVFYFLVNWSLGRLQPRYLESMEETLVDTAHLLAAVVENATGDGPVEAGKVSAAFDLAFARKFDAIIYSRNKQQVDLRVYVTNETGRVIYDSASPGEVGRDYSQWRDVHRTLRGEYGARTTMDDPTDPGTSVLFVAAPVKARSSARILGVVTVGKPTASINQFVSTARREIILAGLAGGALIVAVGFLFSVWIATPIARLTAYARAVRDGRPAVLPRLAGREVGELRQAFEEMRAALEGKTYVERYVQTLTHEIKSPLSAIRGAAEILLENPPASERMRFVENVRAEGARLQRIVDRLLELASLETRKERADFRTIDLVTVVREAVDSAQPAAQLAGVTLTLETLESAPMTGEPMLLSQAASNLIQNALAFTTRGGEVAVSVSADERRRTVRVLDTGLGIPEYALERIFERFYSLPRPGTGAKSTGLGLSLVREIARLHDGEIRVTNRTDRMGTCAELTLGLG